MTTFKDLIDQSDWDTVSSTLMQLYDDAEESIDGYQLVWESLRKMAPVTDKMKIVVDWCPPDEFGDEAFVDVSGIKQSDNLSYSICCTPWQSVLGMEICEDSLAAFTTDEIIAHTLWEITFMGYEEKDIQAVLGDILDKKAECDKHASDV